MVGNLTAQAVLRGLLDRRFSELKADTPNFSLRQFSRSLDQNPAVISEIFSGKRRVSRKLALRLAEKAGTDPQSFQRLEENFKTDERDSFAFGRTPLQASQFDVIAKWHHFAILSLAETKDFKGEATWISKRLGISRRDALQALKHLEELGLVAKGSNGRFVTTGEKVCTTDGISSLALKARHAANLQGARQSLLEDPVDQRDFTFITVASTPEKLSAARPRVRRFMNELCEFLETGEKSEVFEICFQMFPRTKMKKEKRK